MNTVIINGKKYTSNGGSISVVGNKVYIDGKLASDENNSVVKVINITVEGNVSGDISTDVGNITVNGDSALVKSGSGNIKVTGNVNGSISTASGDVEVGGSIGGGVSTASGDVNVKGVINGSTKTVSGDITNRKGILGLFRKDE